MENSSLIMKSKVLAIIPARGGSKRIPNKNKKKLGGKEMIRYAIDAALNSKLLTSIVISSDDEEILDISKTYAEIIPIVRPNDISGDKASAITYVQQAIEYLKDNFARSYDIVVIIQPSSPFTLGCDIDETISLLLDSDDADSSVSVMRLDHAIHPVKLKTLVNNELIPYLEEEKGRMADYDLPELYVRNGSVYVSKIENIKKNKIIGDKCLGYVMPRERSLDINDPIDFDFAEFLIQRQNGK